MSILSQTSSPVGSHHTAIQAPKCCGHRAPERSCIRTCEIPNLPQTGGPLWMQRQSNYTSGCTSSEFMTPCGLQQPPQCSFNHPCENNQYVFNTTSWSPSFRDEQKNYHEFTQLRQSRPEMEKISTPYNLYPPDCFTDDDLDEFHNGRRNPYNNLEELTMMTEVSYCTQTVGHEAPPQQRSFPEHIGRRTTTFKQDTFGRDHTYIEKPRQQNDDGLWARVPVHCGRDVLKTNPNQSH